MDDRQAFKFGFMKRCIEAGLTTPVEMLKQAQDVLATVEKQGGESGLLSYLGLSAAGEAAKGGLEALGHVGSTALGWGVPLALATPPILGGVAGTLAAKAQDIDETDVDEAKNREVLDTYHREADRLRRQGLMRRRSQVGPSSRPMF
jgi:hypothetical protein